MIQLVAFRRSRRRKLPRAAALALCSAAMVASANPASARSHNGTARHAYLHHAGRHAKVHDAYRDARRYRHFARQSRWDAAVAQMHDRGLADANASLGSSTGMTSLGALGSSSLVAEARRYIGGNPTGRGILWCARFMNMVLLHSGYRGTGSDMARSFANYGQPLSEPRIGAIAVMGRRGGGGHVGIVSGIDAHGNVMLVSGNYGNRVSEAPVSRGRIYAYVVPTR